MLTEVVFQIQDTTEGGKKQGRKRPSDNFNNLYVHFYKEGEKPKRGKSQKGEEIGYLSLDHALDCLVNNIYLYYKFDLRDAVHVEVQCH